MRSELIRDIELAGRSVNWRALKIASAALALIGTAGFLFGVLGGEAKRAWQAYLINFVFWTGVSTGAFLLSPIMVITNAHWGRSLKRLAEAAGAFIPVAFVMFWFLFLGREEVFPWLHEHLHVRAKEIWLQVPFLFLRDGAGLLILAGLFVLITYHSVEADIEYLRGHHGGRDRHLRYQSNFAPVYAVAFAFILTLLSFDLIMSLDPHWISTLFGAYYFAGSFYTGIAAVILLSAFAVKQMGMGKYISGKSFHDLGKLLFGFCIVSADFFYVQFLVIWYGNLPEETRYVLARVRFDPWTALAWTVLLLCYVLPFLILLFRKVKMTVWSIAAMSVWVLAAMWLERFFLVAPSVWKAPTLPLGLTELLVSVGYLGIFGLCTTCFLEKFPVMAVSDPLLEYAIELDSHQMGRATKATNV